MRIKKIKLDKDNLCSVFIGIYLVLNELNSVLQNVFSFSGSRLTTAKTVITITIFVIMLFCITHFSKKDIEKLLIIEMLASVLFVYSLVLGVSFGVLQDWAVTSLGICIPLGYMSYVIEDKNRLYNILYYFTWPVFFLLIIDMQGTATQMYDMHFSYMMLFVLLFHLNQAIMKKRKILIPFIIIEALMILMYGSRGGFVCIAAFVVLKLFTNIESKKKKYTLILVTIVIYVAGLYMLNNYGNALLSELQKLGFNGRSLRLILDGRFSSHDSGRNDVWSTTIELIKERPLFGWGIRGAISRLGHPYPHNFFLDFWLSFGLPIGTVLIFFSLVPLKHIIISPKGISKDLYQIFFSMSIIMLMFSGTFFSNYNFYILMGLLLSAKKYQNKVRIQQKV